MVISVFEKNKVKMMVGSFGGEVDIGRCKQDSTGKIELLYLYLSKDVKEMRELVL